MSFIEKYISNDPGLALIPNFEMNAPPATNTLGHVGLELEVEGRRLPTGGHLERIRAPNTGAMWTSHPDGSLRGENQEYVLSQPCNVDEVDNMLQQLYAKFAELGTVLNLSNRCSTHVHVNMAGKKINQLTSVVALWTTYEEALINWCGEERKTNHFCLSTKDSNQLISRWASFLRNGMFDFSEGMKYSALNVRPLYNIGSFEFRCMAASEDYTVISDWTKFVHSLCEFASEEFNDPSAMVPALSERGTIELFADICRRAKTSPRFFDSVLHNEENRNFEAMAMEGFRRAQSIICGYPWTDWLPEINKVYIPSPFGAKPKKRPGRRPLDDGLNAALEAAREELRRDQQTRVARTIRVRPEDPAQPDPMWRNIAFRQAPEGWGNAPARPAPREEWLDNVFGDEGQP